MKIDFLKIKKNLSPDSIFATVFSFLENKTGWLLFALLFSLAGFGGFVWYKYVQNYQWDTVRRQEYMKTKDKGTVFNSNRFNEIIEEKKTREADYQKDMNDLEDFFRLKKD